MVKERLEILKNKFTIVSSNPLMDTIGNIASLQGKLNIEIFCSNNYRSKNRSISSQLLQAQNNFTLKQNNLKMLQTKIDLQEVLVRKLHGYLDDYQDNLVFSTGIENELLVEKLIGEATKLKLE